MMKSYIAAASLALLGLGAAQADEGNSPLAPAGANFTTLVTTALAIEGLTGDALGNLYTTGRQPPAGQSCPVFRLSLSSVSPVIVGRVPAPSPIGQCSPNGIAVGSNGALFISEADKIYTVVPNATTPALATVYASGVPGTNGLAFDRHGNLWTGDGVTGLGRIWKITTGGVVSEALRVPPMANSVAVGRSAVTLPPNTAQPLVANGIAFETDGDMLVADTARGAIWRVKFDRHGNMEANQTSCDTTFTANTLCWNNVWVEHPVLEGADGIALDRAGNVWVAANERNAIAVVASHEGRAQAVFEVFRNPPAATNLRNAGPLEFPTSPFLLGHKLCTANSDGNRRDNSPNTAGELGGAGAPKGKISCMDPPLSIPGLPLPVSAH